MGRMDGARNRIAAPLLTALLYFTGAAFSVHYSRFGGGVAMIWVASAVLAARLSVIELREWPLTLAASAVASTIATGLFGLGWVAAVPLSLVNMAEAAAVAWTFRTLIRTCWPKDVLELVAGFYLVIGLVIPVTSAVAGAGIAHLANGIPFDTNFFHWFVGHAVGLLAIMPFCVSVARTRRFNERLVPKGHGMAGVLLCATMALITFGVFTQTIRPLMLAPLLFVMLTAVWANMAMAMALPVILALVGGVLTLHGLGPMGAMAFDPGDRIQLFQLYVAITALCAMPVAVDQERRRLEIKRLARQERRWRKLSGMAGERIAELAQEAATDPLTGLPNRRAFERALATTIESGTAACIAMVDVDHFKRINDRHGHGVGDEVLIGFAELAGQALRGSDMIARLGGEEFALLLKDASIAHAEMACARLAQRLADNAIVTSAGPLRITVSCGLAELHESGDAAMLAADKALYKAKAAGRARHAVAA
jgi:diguanylate cyclase (GGDEF)-like protein